MTWTAAIIVSAKRGPLVAEIIVPAVAACLPDQLLLVGEGAFANTSMHLGSLEPTKFNYLFVPPMTHSTNDALVKRDVAALACTSEWIAYFSDDHKPAPDFGKQMRLLTGWQLGERLRRCTEVDVYVPARYASQPGHEGERLNNGEGTTAESMIGNQSVGNYCGGHAGVYRKSLIERFPWSAGPHDREWDLLNSRRHMEAGARYCWTDALKVFDCEPDAEPWK